MPDAFIYDHVRTPRGRGKADGALHEVTALNLAAQTLAAVKDRNKLDPKMIDDVVLGCVDPVGEAGGDIARAAALVAGFGDGVPGIQINRFCASGLDAVNFAAAEIMSGQHQMTIGGGAESMSRVGIGASGGAWPVDPSIAVKTYFLPQGISADLIATKYGFSRDDVDAYAVESQKRTAKSWDEGRFKNSVMAVKDCNGLTILAKDEHMRPSTTMQTLAALAPSFVQMGEMGGFDAVAIQRYPEVETINHVHTPGNSSGIVDGAAAVLIGSKEAGQAAGLEAARAHQSLRQYRLGAGDHADRTDPGDREGAQEGRHGDRRHRSVRAQRGLRLGGAALHAGVRHSARQDERLWRRHRHGPSARRHRRDDPRHRARRAGAARSVHRAGHALHRHRHGHGDDHRARLRNLMPKVDIAKVPVKSGSFYPAEFQAEHKGRHKQALGDVVGLTQFGVNISRIEPGASTALRHWHEQEDEFIYMLEGELVLIENDGETVLKAGRRRRLQGRQRHRAQADQPLGAATPSISKSAPARNPNACIIPMSIW